MLYNWREKRPFRIIFASTVLYLWSGLNGWRSWQLWQADDLLQPFASLSVTLTIEALLSGLWAIWFLLLALWLQKRPKASRIMPISLTIYALYQMVLLLVRPAPAPANHWLGWLLVYTLIIGVTTFLLFRKPTDRPD